MTAALAGVGAYFVFGIMGLLVPWARAASALALASGCASFLFWIPGFPLGHLGLGDWAIPWRGDSLAAAFWGLALFLHAAILLEERRRPRHFYALLTLLLGTVLSLVLSQDIFNLYVSLELTSLIAFLLVGIEGKPAQIWASLKYLVLTSCGMILYLLGVGFVYASAGTLSLPELSAAGRFPSDPVFSLGVALLLVGAAAKGGVFLFALWLPVAHGYAPAPVSALLSGLVVKMGIVVLARISYVFPVSGVLIALGFVTGFLGIVHMLWERSLKLFLAYSTMSQLGYILLGFGFGAWEGAVAYAVAHGLFKALLFLAAGSAEEEGGGHLIPELVGRLPWETRALLALGGLAIAGVPLLAGYAAKGLIAAEAPPWGKWTLVALSLGTAASFYKVVPLVGRGEGRLGLEHPGRWLLGAAVVGAGIWGMASFRGLLSFRELLPGFLVPAAGAVLGLLLSKLPVRLPRWRLDAALLALVLAALGTVLRFLFR